MEKLKFRKANIADAEQIGLLISNLLGTNNITNNENESTLKIIEKNIYHVKENINNYIVCCFNNNIVGACGLSKVMHENIYNIKNLPQFREILYLVVDKEFQKQGIGTKLLKLNCENIIEPIIYEAWGDGDYVNSKFLLQKCDFKFLKDLGNTYYKDNGYCPSCVNRNKKCYSCHAEIWVKYPSQLK